MKPKTPLSNTPSPALNIKDNNQPVITELNSARNTIAQAKAEVTKDAKKTVDKNDDDDDKKVAWWWALGASAVGGAMAILFNNHHSDHDSKPSAPTNPISPEVTELPVPDITGINDNIGTIIGNIARGGTSDATNPVLSGSISAPLTASQSIKIFDNGNLLGNAIYDSATNTWHYTDTRSLKNGDNPSYTVLVSDSEGRQSPPSTPYVIHISTLPPTATAAITSVIDDVGAITGEVVNGGNTDDTHLQISGNLSGSLADGETVRIYDGGVFLGTATVDNTSNTWSYNDTRTLVNGDKPSYTAQVINSTGIESAAGVAYKVNIVDLLPAATASISRVQDDSGQVARGAVTNDTTLELQGTLDKALEAGDTVRIYDGTLFLGTAVIDNLNLTWNFTDPRTLDDGAKPFYTAKVTNALGSESNAQPGYNVIVDITPPSTTASVTGVADDVGIVTGNVARDGSTDDTSPVVSGTLSSALVTGETVKVYDGTTLLGTATVDSVNNTWSYADTRTLANGSTPSYTARVADAAGNQSAAGTAYTVTIDTTAPTTTAAVTGVADDVGIVTGNVARGGSTDDTSPVVSGTLSSALVTGETVKVYDGTTLLGTANVDSVNNTWSYADTRTLANGSTPSYTARVADAAGNQSAAGTAYTLTIDTTAPITTASVTGVADDVGTVTGNVARGGSTDDTSPVVSGTLNSALVTGETVKIYDGTTLLGTATVNSVNNTWSYADTRTLANGSTPSYTARVADAAGNQSAAGTAYAVTIETAAPTTTANITGVADNVGVTTGNVSNNSSTDDSSLVISGTISATLRSGETLAIYDGNTRLGTATISQGTSWSYTASSLSTGTHSFTARVEKDTGLNGADSASFNTNITSLSTLSASDNVGASTGVLTSRSSTDDATPTLSGTLTAQLLSGEKVGIYDGTTRLGYATVNASGTGWEYTPTTGLSSGEHTFSAKIEKADGTILIASDDFTLTFVPYQTVEITTVNDNAGGSQGNIANNGVTDDITPLIGGTLSATLGSGDSIVVYDGTTRLGTATVDSSNPSALTWSLAVGPLSGGTHNLTARVENTSGQNGATSGERMFIVSGLTLDTFYDDTATSSGPAFNMGNLPLINETRFIRISGLSSYTTLIIGEVYVYSIVNGVLVNVAAGKAGKLTDNNVGWGGFASTGNTDRQAWFEIDLGGIYNINSVQVRQGFASFDDYGVYGSNIVVSTSKTSMNSYTNEQLAQQNINDVYSYFHPGVLRNFTINAPAVVSDDHTPILSGNIATALTAEQHLYIYQGTTRLGEASIDAATGRWSFVLNELNSGTYSFQAKVENSSTVILSSDNINVTISPDQRIQILGARDSEGRNIILSSGELGYDNTPSFTGTLSGALRLGEQLSVYNNGVRVGVATVDNSTLTWSYQSDTLTKSLNRFSFRVEHTTYGYTINGISTDFNYNYLTSSMNASDNFGNLTGKINNGDVTDDTTPLLSGVLSQPLASGEQLAIYDKTLGRIGYAVVDAVTRTWSFTPTLTSGLYNLSAVVENSAGTVISSPSDYQINVVDPGYVPTQVVAITTVTNGGVIVPDGHSIAIPSNSTAVVLNGTLSTQLKPGDVIRIYASGTLLNGYATVDSTGLAWSYTYYSAGLKNVTAEVYNQATGRVSVSSAAKVVNEIITTNAFGGTYGDDVGSVTGETLFRNTSSTARLNTDDNEPEIKLYFTSAVLSVEQISVYLDGVKVGMATLNAARTVATYAFLTPLALGQHSIELKVENQDGTLSNISVSGYVNIIVPSTGALLTTTDITGYTDNQGVNQGTVTTPVSTDDNTPTLRGTISNALRPGESVVIYRNGTKLGSAIVDASGLTWSYTPSLAAGESNITARVENSGTGDLGNFSPRFTYNYAVTSITSLNDDSGFHTGLFASGSSSDDTSPDLRGTLTSPLLAGEHVAIYVDTTKLAGYATVDPITNTWTYSAPGLTVGNHNITAKIVAADDTILSSSSVYTINIVTNEQLNIVVQTSLNGSAIGNNSALPGVQVTNGRQIDFTQLSSHGKVARVDLGDDKSALTLSLSDVLQSDSNIFDDKIFAGLNTANGQHQMVITSASVNAGTLTITSGTWVYSNDVTAGGQTYHVYNTANNSAQLIVDTDIKNSITSVI
ncbi:hypothetical protein JT31_02585 [Cedecea neteri]|uniref:Uncharacterized protein n=1 Tax=Cedecea neteri TaxID=158822 RepID=A0A089PZ92_9ENTR|nr:hypothetical protein [Cedecea neteri]AIR03539.1 hypothetical protein JT31_02585 [Cedecea neteri]